MRLREGSRTAGLGDGALSLGSAPHPLLPQLHGQPRLARYSRRGRRLAGVSQATTGAAGRNVLISSCPGWTTPHIASGPWFHPPATTPSGSDTTIRVSSSKSSSLGSSGYIAFSVS